MTEPREWTLGILAPCEWLTSNRINNRYSKFERSGLTRQWREAVVLHARHAKLPTGIQRITVEAVARFRDRPPVRDSSNLNATLKAVVDGLTPHRVTMRAGKPVVHIGCGLIPDDSDKHVLSQYIRIGEPLKKHLAIEGHPGLLMLTIREVSP